MSKQWTVSKRRTHNKIGEVVRDDGNWYYRDYVIVEGTDGDEDATTDRTVCEVQFQSISKGWPKINTDAEAARIAQLICDAVNAYNKAQNEPPF